VSQLSFQGEAEESRFCMWLKNQIPSNALDDRNGSLAHYDIVSNPVGRIRANVFIR